MVKPSSSLVALFAYLPMAVMASGFKAEVDRHQLAPHESVTLTLTLSNADIRLRAEGLEPNIDLSPLHKDFDVGVPKANFRYNIYQGRGRSSSELKVTLHPKHPGPSTIPVFEINGEATQAIELEIVPQTEENQAPEIFVQAGTLHQGPLWLGQQLVVYLDVFHRIELSEATFSDQLETEPMRIELLPHWRLPQQKTQQQHQNYNYQVQRMSWAIFPQEAGEFNVYLPSVKTLTTDDKELNFSHQKLVFQVKALPEGLPADLIIGKPDVQLSPLPASINQHQLESWTVSINAPVKINGLPKFLPSPSLAPSLQSYPDKAIRDTVKTPQGLSHRATYSHSIIASEAGEFNIPVQLIPYFDPLKGEVSHVTIAKQHFSVESASLSSNQQTLLASVPASKSPSAEPTTWQWLSLGLVLTNLLSLSLLFKKIRATNEARQDKKISNNTDQSSSHTPIASLLTELNADSLEELLCRWQTLPNNALRDELQTQTRQLQRLAYSNKETVDNTSIEEMCSKIAHSAKSIGFTEEKQKKRDKWLPEETLK